MANPAPHPAAMATATEFGKPVIRPSPRVAGNTSASSPVRRGSAALRTPHLTAAYASACLAVGERRCAARQIISPTLALAPRPNASR